MPFIVDMNAKQLLGWNLRKARVSKGVSQQQLALDCGIDPAYVGRIERGLENLSINILEMLAMKLDVPIADLFRLPEPGESKPPVLKAGRKKKD